MTVLDDGKLSHNVPTLGDSVALKRFCKNLATTSTLKTDLVSARKRRLVESLKKKLGYSAEQLDSSEMKIKLKILN